MIGFEARSSEPSLETNFFLIHTYRMTESRMEACYALPKNQLPMCPEIVLKVPGGGELNLVPAGPSQFSL